MRNIFKLTLLILSVLIMSVSCKEEFEKQSYVMEGTDLGGVMPNVTFLTPKIFDVADAANTALKFKMNVATVGQYSEFKQVVISKSFNEGDPVVHMTIPASEIPKEVVISIADAVAGFDIAPSEVAGGDFIDWSFMVEFDDPDIKFNDDALTEAFPDFRSYFASPLEDQIEGTYTATLISSDFDGVGPDETINNYQITVVPGTSRSQFSLQDVSMNAIPKSYDFIPQLSDIMFHIGNGQFVLATTGGAGGYEGFFPVSGTAVRSGNEITVTVQFLSNFLDGNNLSFKLTPVE